MTVQIKPSHTYRFIHAKSRAVLDLSMADFKSVAAGTWADSDNQKWVAERARSVPETGATRWTFRNVATGLYLGIDGAPRSAARVAATRTETEWDVRPDREDPAALRVVVPTARLALQLGDKGIPQQGAPAMLWENRDGEDQRWQLEEDKRSY
ncbi:hypothetical protein BD309DRAFT_954872 [Dichomitus squalens]|uniref:Ricin B lectin domain-containing protein n=1 Tax=Dichomitus squalens TaxID=114155 RepID=A0A4Q9P1Z6_9APHY|nr:hypothetical protein BD311DRAFT_866089 [Dichomitus squalens]TBU46046.1 hypothetical protein BD309DRAFT_954872 [Dichomitus squalens]TBU60329.1 hypothetical protein BD310DRAFT_848024 [Dichomitus squalens]